MIRLILNGSDIVPSTSANIKITRANPRLTQKGDYTYELEIPLDIFQNKVFFGHLDRIDTSRTTDIYTAQLYVDNKLIIDGSAKVTSATEKVVKVQLYGERSDFNARFNEKYIDELTLPRYSPWNNTRSTPFDGRTERVAVPAYDAENDRIINLTTPVNRGNGNIIYNTGASFSNTIYIAFWQLNYIVKSVLEAMGLDVDMSVLDREPIRHIYVARCSVSMAAAIPHWTVKEFIDQLLIFLNLDFSYTPDGKAVFSEKMPADAVTHIEPIGEFSVETTDDNDAAYTYSNCAEYNIDEGEYRVYDRVSQDNWKDLPKREFDSAQAMNSAYVQASDADKANYVWVSPDGAFTQMVFSHEGESVTLQRRINMFGLVVDPDANGKACNIVPCPMCDDVQYPVYRQRSDGLGPLELEQYGYIKMPVIQLSKAVSVSSSSSIQSILEGWAEEEVDGSGENMEVFLYDGRMNPVRTSPYGGAALYPSNPVPMAFTDYMYKNEGPVAHESWSLAREGAPNMWNDTWTPVESAVKIDGHNKYTIKFVSDDIPAATDIFIINGKKFVAEKIEANVKNGTMERLKTGYFYKVLS